MFETLPDSTTFVAFFQYSCQSGNFKIINLSLIFSYFQARHFFPIWLPKRELETLQFRSADK
jgi:hypothetical protein